MSLLKQDLAIQEPPMLMSGWVAKSAGGGTIPRSGVSSNQTLSLFLFLAVP